MQNQSSVHESGSRFLPVLVMVAVLVIVAGLASIGLNASGARTAAATPAAEAE